MSIGPGNIIMKEVQKDVCSRKSVLETITLEGHHKTSQGYLLD